MNQTEDISDLNRDNFNTIMVQQKPVKNPKTQYLEEEKEDKN